LQRSQDSPLHRQYAIGKIAKFNITFAMRIYVMALDGVFDTGLATVLDAFETANVQLNSPTRGPLIARHIAKEIYREQNGAVIQGRQKKEGKPA
jgi:hypothetical protein